jgi:hypothetical protein
LVFSCAICAFVLSYPLVLGSQKPVKNLAADFSLAEVREHAESLNRWFEDALVEHPESSDSLGMGPKLASELVHLTFLPGLGRETAERFAERVQSELKGYKGTPFFGLYHLSRRLVQLTDNNRTAEQCPTPDRPCE